MEIEQRRIVWTDEAIASLEAINAYISLFDANAASRLAERLLAAAESLSQFSERGKRAGPVYREWSIISPYVIRYRVTKKDVIIVRIRHGAMQRDDES